MQDVDAAEASVKLNVACDLVKNTWELQILEDLYRLLQVERGFIHCMKSIYDTVSLSILKKICFPSLQKALSSWYWFSIHVAAILSFSLSDS